MTHEVPTGSWAQRQAGDGQSEKLRFPFHGDPDAGEATAASWVEESSVIESSAANVVGLMAIKWPCSL